MFPSGREHEFTGKIIKIDSAGEGISTRSLTHIITRGFDPISIILLSVRKIA
jgi:hypothetical protein